MADADSDAADLLLRNHGQGLCIDRIREVYAGVPAPPAGLTPAQAFSCLRGSSTGYSPVPLQGARVTFDLERCSMPPPLNCAHPVVQSLSGKPHEEIVNWRERILKPESERHDYMHGKDRIKPYLDPKLVRDSKVYAKFLQRLDGAGILSWKVGIQSWLGVFFVAKKNGKLRIILDTRDVNGVFKPPPYTGLPTAAALTSIETNPDETIWFAGADIADCFYRLEVPLGLDEYFSLPGILGSEVEAIARKHRLPLRAKLVPCLKVLPMGWSWSLYFAQQVHEARILKCGFEARQFIRDKVPGSKLDAESDKVAVYVDNHLVMGESRERVVAGSMAIAADLNAVDLDTHEAFEDCECDFVGLHFDGRPGRHRVRLKWDRVWRIRLAIMYILDCDFASGKDIQVVVGHITWAMLLRREALAILNAVYAFARLGDEKVKLWGTVRCELRQVADLLPLFFCDTSLGWADKVMCSDSCDSGFGVLKRKVDVDTVAAWGRQSEKFRYLFEDSVGAREHALQDDPEYRQDDEQTYYDTAASRSDDSGFFTKFSEIDKAELSNDLWTHVYSAPWRVHGEDITYTEGKAALFAARHCLRDSTMHNRRIVLLIDNLGLVLALNKGRSSKPRIAKICRAFAALSLASGSRFVARWVPSEYNPADAPSRRFEKAGKAASALASGEATARGPREVDRVRSTSFMHEAQRHPPAARGAHDAAGKRHRAGSIGGVRSGVGRISLVAALAGCLPSADFGWSGSEPGDVLRRTLEAYGPVCSRREDHGSLWAPLTNDCRVAELQVSECEQGNQGLEAALPLPHTGAFALHGHDLGSRDVAPPPQARDGDSGDAVFQRISPAIGMQQPSGRAGRGPAGVRRCAFSVPSDRPPPLRRARAEQSGPLRREHPGGLGVVWERGDKASLGASAKPKRRCPALDLDAPRIRRRVGGDHGAAGLHQQGPHNMPVRAPTRGRVARHAESPPPGSRHQGAGTVGHRPERASIPKGQPGPGRTGKTFDGPAAGGEVLLSKRGPDVHGQAVARADVEASTPVKEWTRASIFAALNARFDKELETRGNVSKGFTSLTGVHLELFAGCGRHSRKLHMLGLPCLAFDYLTDPVLGDLTNCHVQACIMSWIQQGLIASVWLGTPCTTWCIALNRFPKCRLRSSEELFGLGSLNEKQRAKVLLGNRTAKFTVRVLNVCVGLGVPAALENPDRSLLFEVPGLVRLQRHRSHTLHKVTMCAFGARWRKATQIHCWNCSYHHFDSCFCKGRSGVCSYSNKQHIQLQGKSEAGPNWTTIASAYPHRLCYHTSRMMATAALDRVTHDHLWR